MCFSDPQLRALLSYASVSIICHIFLTYYQMSNTCHFVQVQIFVDATNGIVLVFDMVHCIYIPCAWVLMTGKTSECYWQVFNWLATACPNLDPSYIGVDFE